MIASGLAGSTAVLLGAAAIGFAPASVPARSDGAAGEVGTPVSIVGSAEVKVRDDGERASSKVIFAAAIEPPVVRMEVVRGGTTRAVVWCDSEQLQVLVPGSPPRLHETQPTRAGFERTLGIRTCLEELVFALRGGHAPVPTCGADAPEPRLKRQGRRVVGLVARDPGTGGERRVRFSRFRTHPLPDWPGRVTLRAGSDEAVVRFDVVQPRDQAPLGLPAELVERAEPVGVSELRRLLGLEE